MSKIDNVKWNLFCKKYNILLRYGFMTGKIRPYDEELIDKLKKYIMVEFRLLLY